MFRGDVYLFNGDSHLFNSDRPLASGSKWLGFYGVEAESAAEADRWEGAIRKVLSHNVRLGMMQVHRQGLVLVVVWRDWPDGVSPECWRQ